MFQKGEKNPARLQNSLLCWCGRSSCQLSGRGILLNAGQCNAPSCLLLLQAILHWALTGTTQFRALSGRAEKFRAKKMGKLLRMFYSGLSNVEFYFMSRCRNIMKNIVIQKYQKQPNTLGLSATLGVRKNLKSLRLWKTLFLSFFFYV